MRLVLKRDRGRTVLRPFVNDYCSNTTGSKHHQILSNVSACILPSIRTLRYLHKFYWVTTNSKALYTGKNSNIAWYEYSSYCLQFPEVDRIAFNSGKLVRLLPIWCNVTCLYCFYRKNGFVLASTKPVSGLFFTVKIRTMDLLRFSYYAQTKYFSFLSRFRN